MKVDPKEVLQKIRRETQRTMVHLDAETGSEASSITEQANEFVRGWLQNPINKEPNPTSRELESMLVDLAHYAHGASWAHTQDDSEAWALQRQMIYERAAQEDRVASELLPHMLASDGYQAFGWQPKWYHFGCQSLEVEDRYAASLCATQIARSELDDVRLPWPCFIVRVPKVLESVTIQGEALKLIVVNHVRHLVDGGFRDRYQLHLLSSNRFRIVPTAHLSDWVKPNSEKGYDILQMASVERGELERRQFEVLGRFVLGTVISMNDPKSHKQYGKLSQGKGPSIGSPRYGTHNEVVLHKIGRPVRVDARDVVQSYITGQTGRVSSVRTLVAGHWKHQPHGPKSTLRRWQHIECYWRGEEGDPLIIRPHVLSKGR